MNKIIDFDKEAIYLLTAIQSHIEKLEKIYEFTNDEEELKLLETDLDFYDELEMKLRNYTSNWEVSRNE